MNLNKEGLIPDRLSGERPAAAAGPHRGKRSEPATPTSTTPELPDMPEDSPQSRHVLASPTLFMRPQTD